MLHTTTQLIIGRYREDGDFDTFAALNNNNLELAHDTLTAHAQVLLDACSKATGHDDLVIIEREELTDTITID